MRVLVVHGMYCTAAHTTLLAARLQALGHEVEALDLPRPAGTGLGDHVKYLLRAAKEAEALVGHSMGGLLALLAAPRLPVLRRLVLLGCAPPAGLNGFSLPNLRAFLPAVIGGGEHRIRARVYDALFMNRQEAALQEQVRAALVPEPRRLIRAVVLPAFDRTHASRLRLPEAPHFETLVFSGSGDRSTPPRMQAAIAALVPKARHVALESPDHYGFIDGVGSEETLAALAEFLSEDRTTVLNTH